MLYTLDMQFHRTHSCERYKSIPPSSLPLFREEFAVGMLVVVIKRSVWQGGSEVA